MRIASRTRFLGTVGLTAPLLLAMHALALGDEPGSAPTLVRRMRHPVAIANADGGKTIIVANRRSGSLSVIDTASRSVVAEDDVGRGLADLVSISGGRYLLALDQTANEFLLLGYQDRRYRVLDRLTVSPDPVRLALSADGSTCVVASLWSRRLTFVSLAPTPKDGYSKLSIAGSLDLPFCPRELAAFPGGSKLIVADAFGGRLAVVDIGRHSIDSVRTLPRTISEDWHSPPTAGAAADSPGAQPVGPGGFRRCPLGPPDPQSPPGPAG